jgi:hypothetical protein
MTVPELLRGVVKGCITEDQLFEEFSRFFRGGSPIPDAEAQCLSELVEDVNMAEHIGPLFDDRFVWRVEESLQLVAAGASASVIRKLFATNRAG